MEIYEEIIYNYQTQSRGLLSKEELENHFIKMLPYFDYHLKKYLPKDKNISIIEIPCGSGKFLYYLKSMGYTNFKGYDFDKQQIELAKKLALPAFEGNAIELIKEIENQDVIAAIDFFEHLDKNDAVRFLISCYQKLKPNGLIIIRVPSADGIFGMSHMGNDFTHHWVLTENAWKYSLLPVAGFKKENIIVNDDRVPPKNLLLNLIFRLSNTLFKLYIKSLAMGPPNILSRSMWIVARKTSD